MWNQAFFSLPSETNFSLQFQISLPKRKWGRTLLPIIENSSGDGSLGNGLAKNEFGTDKLGLLRPKTTLNLC
jgi:hypothetical protein